MPNFKVIPGGSRRFQTAHQVARNLHSRVGSRAISPEEQFAFDLAMEKAKAYKAESQSKASAWDSAGEFLLRVKQADRSPDKIDHRLLAPQAGALGANEAIDSAGGFAVPTEVSKDLIHRLYDQDEILGQCARIPMGSSQLSVPMANEASRLDGQRYGGVKVARTIEAGWAQTSLSTLDAVVLTANKLVGATVLTNELQEDTNAAALDQWINWAFPAEFRFQQVGEVFGGSGVGEFLGIRNSGAAIVVQPDAGQPSQTVTVSNIENMWARLWAPNRRGAAWYMNQQVEQQLLPLARDGQPLYTPAGLYGNTTGYGMMLGLPVIPLEQGPVLGQQGDITLADLGEYLIGDRRDVNLVTSMHVLFFQDQNSFRWTMRNDGSPKWKSPITPYNDGVTLSPFVLLGARP